MTTDDRMVKRLHVWSWTRPGSWDQRVEKLLEEHNLHDMLIPNPASAHCMNIAKLTFISIDENNWYSDLWNDVGKINGNKLRTYRAFKASLDTEPYVFNVVNVKHRQILAKFRCGNLKLKIETGRYSRPPIPLNDRKCILCNSNAVEDECHF